MNFYYILLILQFKGNEWKPSVRIVFGILIFESDEHSQKARLPILKILSGNVIFVSDEQFEKALFPISLTSFWIVNIFKWATF